MHKNTRQINGRKISYSIFKSNMSYQNTSNINYLYFELKSHKIVHGVGWNFQTFEDDLGFRNEAKILPASLPPYFAEKKSFPLHILFLILFFEIFFNTWIMAPPILFCQKIVPSKKWIQCGQKIQLPFTSLDWRDCTFYVHF